MIFDFRNFLVATLIFSFLLTLTYAARGMVAASRKYKRSRAGKSLGPLMEGILSPKDKKWCRRNSLYLLEIYIELSQSLTLGTEQEKRLIDYMGEWGHTIKLVRDLSSGRTRKRSRAIRYLGYLNCEISRNALVNSLIREKKESVKIYLVHSLSQLSYSAAVPDMIDSLKGCSRNYIYQVAGLLQKFRGTFIALFPQLSDHPDPNVQLLIIEFARVVPNTLFSAHLQEIFAKKTLPDEIREKAFSALVESYPHLVNFEEAVKQDNCEIREMAIMGLGTGATERGLELLCSLLNSDSDGPVAEKSLSNMISGETALFRALLERYREAPDDGTRDALSRVLSTRIDSILPQLDRGNREEYAPLIAEVLRSGRTSGLITFLNGNHSKEIEEILLSQINQTLRDSKGNTEEIQVYLKPALLDKLGLPQKPVPTKRINEKQESIRKRPLVLMLILSAVLVSLFFIVPPAGGKWPPEWSRRFSLGTDRFFLGFGFYCLALNLLYFILFFFSFMNGRKQRHNWKLKDDSLLFSKGMLPSLSILVPAYGEEQTIIENVHSLLNLRYPEFEVIIINDGSRDNTMQVLIDHFDLDKIDRNYKEKLKTQPVRGIYANRAYPELLVVDKINGGKADSLNTGLNLAGKDYFVGIDSDSIIERDALLKLTSAFLDSDKPVLAAGGNIMPVNGCEVDRGSLEKIGLPREAVPLFQFVEYVRSFISGRMGWAYMGSLLIISGAFGVFKREKVLEISGYLTSREYYMKDTVGEDMELVVRLRRDMNDRGEKGAFLYQFQSDCWTEVPARLSILRKQRERWQRGLIDILSFHRKMIGNPRYGAAGVLGFPYYLIAEVLGPWLETFANLIFLPALIAGWISLPVLFLIIGSNLVLSFALSLGSMLILDWDESRFSPGDRIKMLILCLAETFGFRQLVSFYRITGFVGVLRNVTGWGAMTRQGFAKKEKRK